MPAVTSNAGRPASRGRIDKRQAILDAAFAVFARRGYAQACVQEIAEEACVAKPTIYNHLNDKETLFRHALAAASDAVLAENLAVVQRLRDPGPDLRAALKDLAYRLIRVCCAERSRSLRRLTYGQVAQFPDLIDIVVSRTSDRLAEALADRLARLSLSGRLRADDPATAAEQFLVLITGPMEGRSRLGTRKVAPAEMRAVATAAVDTFLRAYGVPEDE
ncbi:TetR/AcrR family transcriptional regulator [Nocardia implantans]|uniref:TetR/AcrR family transcriptional regulator n=1 Tax=Nocardia implantans TaxID=3108168 RepID=A0ABU6ARY8_9NOCA|nr:MULTISPECIES: TetR/AcrR family transcriptional regulator [unclassified Nocardia]MBF6191686.1 TetR/AcrR family transcriptional regulator [Nocardia beijingensis]MEA3528005.1 TetR/AcrR family transcriptional regulator [Nocardia sp. CDC192]MEB3510243.1 TetR/AcrR family transcriptional regulator [Nocardia sp. CDC186]